MEQAGEVDYLITWRDNEFVGRVSLARYAPALVGRGSCLIDSRSPDSEVQPSFRAVAARASRSTTRQTLIGGRRHSTTRPTREPLPQSS
jgi:hypothetical protein